MACGCNCKRDEDHGYYWCDFCQQQRLSGWIKDGKCSRCGHDVRFVQIQNTEKETREINLGKGIIEVNGEIMQATDIKAEWADEYTNHMKEFLRELEMETLLEREKKQKLLEYLMEQEACNKKPACPFQSRVVYNPSTEKLDFCRVVCPQDERCMAWGLTPASGMQKTCRLIP